MFETDSRYREIAQARDPFRAGGPDESRTNLDRPEREGMDDGHPLDSGESELIHKRLLAHYANELDIQSEQRAAMREDERFFDGDQWDEGDATLLRARGQMPLVFNVIAPAINWMLGTERQNRTQYKVLPREKSDGRAARLKTELMKYVDDTNHTDFAWSGAFADAVKVGIGWIEEGWQGDSGEEPIFIRHESWRNVLWDSRASGLGLEDARYMFRPKWVDLDIAKQLFPGPRNDAVLEASASTSGDVLGSLVTTGDESMDEGEQIAMLAHTSREDSAGRRRLRLIEGWYRTIEERPYVKGGSFSGELFDVTSPGHGGELDSGKATIRWRTAPTIRVAIFTATGLLWDSPTPYRHNRFPFTPIWGNRRGSDNMPYGIIRNLKDIQRDINKRHSKATHILNSSKILAERGAILDMDAFAEEAARPDAILEYEPGRAVTIDHGKEMGSAQIDLMSRNIEMVQQTSGITDEAMGRQTNANSGKAIEARQRQGSVATAHFLDNLRLARRLSGEKALSLIEQFYTDEKAFRITNNRGTPEYLKINDQDAENDILRSKADFVIAEDAWRATQRQAEMQELMELMQQVAPVAPQIVVTLLDLLVEAMDIPSREEIVSRIRKLTGMTDPDMTDEEKAADPELQARAAQEAEQAAMMKRMAEAEASKLEAEAAEKGARAKLAGIQSEGAAASNTATRLATVQASLEAALTLLQSAMAAPVADRLLADAEVPGPQGTEMETISTAAGPVPQPPTAPQAIPPAAMSGGPPQPEPIPA